MILLWKLCPNFLRIWVSSLFLVSYFYLVESFLFISINHLYLHFELFLVTFLITSLCWVEDGNGICWGECHQTWIYNSWDLMLYLWLVSCCNTEEAIDKVYHLLHKGTWRWILDLDMLESGVQLYYLCIYEVILLGHGMDKFFQRKRINIMMLMLIDVWLCLRHLSEIVCEILSFWSKLSLTFQIWLSNLTPCLHVVCLNIGVLLMWW